MRNPTAPRAMRGVIVLVVLLVSSGAGAADLYLAGNIGISALSGDGSGTNDFINQTHSGSDVDSTPIYGSSLGVAFPLNRALPWKTQTPRLSIPYWPGRALETNGEEELGFPDWPVRFEVEYLRGVDAELSTPGVNPQEPYHADLEAWSVMAKLRMDLPIRQPVRAIAGRVPFLEPLSLYAGGGTGISFNQLGASNSVIFGSKSDSGFAWQAIAGIGYELNDRVHWSIGWRYQDLGTAKAALVDATGTPRGRYTADLSAHEFTTSLSFTFWRVFFLDAD
jgi:opacity protein-like surface antigen